MSGIQYPTDHVNITKWRVSWYIDLVSPISFPCQEVISPRQVAHLPRAREP